MWKSRLWPELLWLFLLVTYASPQLSFTEGEREDSVYKSPDLEAVPSINVYYSDWKPINLGHPMNDDPTLVYLPPALGSVHFGPEPPPEKPIYPIKPENPPVYIIEAQSDKSHFSPIYGTPNSQYFKLSKPKRPNVGKHGNSGISLVQPPQFIPYFRGGNTNNGSSQVAEDKVSIDDENDQQTKLNDLQIEWFTSHETPPTFSDPEAPIPGDRTEATLPSPLAIPRPGTFHRRPPGYYHNRRRTSKPSTSTTTIATTSSTTTTTKTADITTETPTATPHLSSTPLNLNLITTTPRFTRPHQIISRRPITDNRKTTTVWTTRAPPTLITKRTTDIKTKKPFLSTRFRRPTRPTFTRPIKSSSPTTPTKYSSIFTRKPYLPTKYTTTVKPTPSLMSYANVFNQINTASPVKHPRDPLVASESNVNPHYFVYQGYSKVRKYGINAPKTSTPSTKTPTSTSTVANAEGSTIPPPTTTIPKTTETTTIPESTQTPGKVGPISWLWNFFQTKVTTRRPFFPSTTERVITKTPTASSTTKSPWQLISSQLKWAWQTSTKTPVSFTQSPRLTKSTRLPYTRNTSTRFIRPTKLYFKSTTSQQPQILSTTAKSFTRKYVTLASRTTLKPLTRKPFFRERPTRKLYTPKPVLVTPNQRHPPIDIYNENDRTYNKTEQRRYINSDSFRNKSKPNQDFSSFSESHSEDDLIQLPAYNVNNKSSKTIPGYVDSQSFRRYNTIQKQTNSDEEEDVQHQSTDYPQTIYDTIYRSEAQPQKSLYSSEYHHWQEVHSEENNSQPLETNSEEFVGTERPSYNSGTEIPLVEDEESPGDELIQWKKSYTINSYPSYALNGTAYQPATASEAEPTRANSNWPSRLRITKPIDSSSRWPSRLQGSDNQWVPSGTQSPEWKEPQTYPHTRPVFFNRRTSSGGGVSTPFEYFKNLKRLSGARISPSKTTTTLYPSRPRG